MIAGRQGVFLVLFVDEEEQRADVVSLSRITAVAEDVRLSDVLPYDQHDTTEASSP